MAIPKPNSIFFWYVWRESFCLCGHSMDCFVFFLATILIVAMFNFQFWIKNRNKNKTNNNNNNNNNNNSNSNSNSDNNNENRLLVLVNMLHISYFFTFLNLFLNWNTFPFGCPHRFDIALFQFIILLIKLDRIYIFFHILSSFVRPQVKTLIVKFR